MRNLFGLFLVLLMCACESDDGFAVRSRRLVGGADAQLVGSYFEGKNALGGYNAEDQVQNAYNTELQCRKFNVAKQVIVEMTEHADGTRDFFWKPVFVELMGVPAQANGYFHSETDELFGGVTRRGVYDGQLDSSQSPTLFWVRASEAYSIPQGTCFLYYTLIAQLVAAQ